MAKKKKKEKFEKHEVLREIYRHYIDFQDYYMRTGQHVIENIPILSADKTRIDYIVDISFLDLKTGFEQLTKRKQEAFWYNIILDMTQKEAGKIMGIREVTVGQYTANSCKILSKKYFNDIISPHDG